MDGYERRDIMLAVASDEGMDDWSSRLDRTASVGPASAMRMLTELELVQDSPLTEGFADDRPSSATLFITVIGIIIIIFVSAILNK